MTFFASQVSAITSLSDSSNLGNSTGSLTPSITQESRFDQAMIRAKEGHDSISTDSYVKMDNPAGAGLSSDSSMVQVSDYGKSLSKDFKKTSDDVRQKISNVDFTSPALLTDMMNAQYGFMCVSAQLSLASAGSGKALEGITTLFKNQG